MTRKFLLIKTWTFQILNKRTLNKNLINENVDQMSIIFK